MNNPRRRDLSSKGHVAKGSGSDSRHNLTAPIQSPTRSQPGTPTMPTRVAMLVSGLVCFCSDLAVTAGELNARAGVVRLGWWRTRRLQMSDFVCPVNGLFRNPRIEQISLLRRPIVTTDKMEITPRLWLLTWLVSWDDCLGATADGCWFQGAADSNILCVWRVVWSSWLCCHVPEPKQRLSIR